MSRLRHFLFGTLDDWARTLPFVQWLWVVVSTFAVADLLVRLI